VHLYKYKGLLTKEEDQEYIDLAKIAELRNPDQMHGKHSNEDEEESGATEMVGPATRKSRRLDHPEKRKLPVDEKNPHALDNQNRFSWTHEITQSQRWISQALKKASKVEEICQGASNLLKCSIETLVPSLKQALEDGTKEKLELFQRQ
jgi:hypothetical protein